MSRRSPGRAGAEWKRARALVLKDATNCALCGRPLDFDAPPRSRWAPSVDHVVSLSAMTGAAPLEQRKMALDIANLRAVHLGCNARRGAGLKSTKPTTERTSRQW